MNIRRRLFRKPFSTLLWLVFVALMTGFLSAAVTLWYSASRLAKTLDRSHTAIAVRSDPGVVVHPRKRNAEWEVDFRSFTERDAAALAETEGVKAIRTHTLTGGSSPAFLPITEIRREFSWFPNGDISPYYDAVFAGKLVEIKKGTIRNEYNYQTIFDGSDQNDRFLLFELEDALLLNDEFAEPLKNMRYVGGFSYAVNLGGDPDAESFFTVGEHYVVSGTFEPRARTSDWATLLNPDLSSFVPPQYFIIEGGTLARRDGYLERVGGRDVPWSYEMRDGSESAQTAVPAAAHLEGDAKTFFEDTPYDAWRTYRDAWELQAHALPVIGTERVETVTAFLTGDAAILDGRSFTDEEYETGAHVMLISEKEANRAGLSVGDTVSLSQFLMPEKTAETLRSGLPLNNPVVDPFAIDRAYADAEPFEIVGIYRLQAEWSSGTYAFTANTVFIPKRAQIAGGFGTLGAGTDDAEPDGRSDVYGIYLSLELQNGSVEEFQLALDQSPYAGQFYVYDQGYEAVQKDINGLKDGTARLLWIAAGGWILLLILYLLMYQSAQRRNIGVMRSLGASPGRVGWYLAAGGILVAIAGVAIGTVLSRIVLESVESRVLNDMLGMVDRTAGAVLSDEALESMVKNSVPSLKTAVLVALAQLGVMSAAIGVHAGFLSRIPPRRLSEG